MGQRFLQELGREDEEGGGHTQLTRRGCWTSVLVTPDMGGDVSVQHTARNAKECIPGQE